MDDQRWHPVDQAIELARLIRKENRTTAYAVRAYWALAFHATRLIERTVSQKPSLDPRKTVLNFGCGNNFNERTINSDLFAIHRFIQGKRKPDLYWTGTTDLRFMHERFDGIICEHVIEHLLPDQLQTLFMNFLHMLKPKGKLVISFPDVRKILARNDTQGFSSPLVSLNSVIYRYGHSFMYDSQLVSSLLQRAGFIDSHETSFGEAPLRDFLEPARERESCYVAAQAMIR